MIHLFKGQHFIADIETNDLKNLFYSNELLQEIKNQLTKWHTTPLKECYYIFNKGGYSLNILISESHFSIHTYPEYKKLFLDFFTCSEYFIKNKDFKDFLNHLFNIKKLTLKSLIRGDLNK